MTAYQFLPIWMERKNMPFTEERIVEMRPEEWIKFANDLVKENKEQDSKK